MAMHRDVLLAGCLIAALALLSSCGTSTTGPTAAATPTEQPSAQLTTRLPGAGGAQFLAASHGDLWIPDLETGRLIRIDATTGRVIATITVGPVVPPRGNATGVAAGDLGVWVTKTDTESIAQVDPLTNRLGRTISIGVQAAALTEGFGSLWAAAPDDREVLRIDPSSARVLAVLHTDDAPQDVAAGGGYVWVTLLGQTMLAIDPGSNQTTTPVTFPRGARPRQIAIDAAGVWVALEEGRAVARVDARTHQVLASIPLSAPVESIALGRGAMWAIVGHGDTVLVQVDEVTGKVRQTLHPSHTASGIAFAGGWIWTDNIDATYSRFRAQSNP